MPSSLSEQSAAAAEKAAADSKSEGAGADSDAESENGDDDDDEFARLELDKGGGTHHLQQPRRCAQKCWTKP